MECDKKIKKVHNHVW